tara:strand:- start:5507 stop:6088 length:582 start_codon:yes stop_codon:yes gene_type:complete
MSSYFFNGEYEWGSKYVDVNLGLYEIVKQLKPNKIIELGVGTGGTTISMARALQENKNGGKIHSFDMFDNNFLDSHEKGMIYQELKSRELDSFVELQEGDVFDTWIKNPTEFDMLWIDLCNTWDVIYDIIVKNKFINSKIKNGAHVYIEGGHERHPRMNQSTLNLFNNKMKRDIFKCTLQAGSRISVSKVELL